jgi:hypothetical protein
MLMRKDEEIQKLQDSNKLFINSYNNNKSANEYNYLEDKNNIYNNLKNQNLDLKSGESSLWSSGNYQQSGNVFIKDYDNENELKNLITGNHSRKPSISFNFSKENTQYDSNSSMKIPGRIVSLKKK